MLAHPAGGVWQRRTSTSTHTPNFTRLVVIFSIFCPKGSPHELPNPNPNPSQSVWLITEAEAESE